MLRRLLRWLAGCSSEEATLNLSLVDAFFRSNPVKVAFQAQEVPTILSGRRLSHVRAATLILSAGGRFWMFSNPGNGWHYQGYREFRDVMAEAIEKSSNNGDHAGVH